MTRINHSVVCAMTNVKLTLAMRLVVATRAQVLTNAIGAVAVLVMLALRSYTTDLGTVETKQDEPRAGHQARTKL